MIGFLVFGPLLFGLWLVYKGLRDDRAWLIIRVIWLVLGVGLIGFGALQGAIAAAPILQAIMSE